MKVFTDEELNRLREALAEEYPSCAPEGCPSKDELWESAAGDLDPLENEPIILHLTECSECSMIWRLAREMVLPDRVSSTPVIPLSRGRRWQTWRKVFVPAIAATVLIGVGLSAAWLVRKGASPAPVFRQQPGIDSILASPGTQQLPRAACRLEWSAAPDRDPLRSHRHRSAAGDPQHGQRADATGIRPSFGSHPDLHNRGVVAGHRSSARWTHGFF